MYNELVLEVINDEGKKDRFYSAFLNENHLLEFRYSTIDFGSNVQMVYNKGSIYVRNTLNKKVLCRKIDKKEASKAESYRSSIISDLSNLYKNIINDKEDVMVIYLGDKSKYKYLFTTKKALDKRHLSPKYNDALEFCFSNKMLDQHGLKRLDIKNNSEMQIELNKALKDKEIDIDNKGVGYIKYSKIINLLSIDKDQVA